MKILYPADGGPLTGALLFWILPGTPEANFPFLEEKTSGSLDVPSIFSLFNKPLTAVCGDQAKTEVTYAYAAWPFSGNTQDSDRNAEKSAADEDYEKKKSCCSDGETEQQPDTGDTKEGSGTG